MTPEYDVPADETPAARCPYCERPFRGERGRDLHVGEDHPEAATEAELATYEAARDAEREDLFLYHLKVIAGLAALYGGTGILYMVALGSGFL